MHFKDMRNFLEELEREGQVVRIKKEVDTNHEIAAYARKACNLGEGPVFIFENVKNYPGWKVVTNLFGSRERVAKAFGSTQKSAVSDYAKAKSQLTNPEIFEDSAPCQEIVWTGSEVDLNKLPIVKHAKLDAGPYITIGAQVTKSPVTGIRAVGIHRQQIMGKNRLALWAHSERHIGRAILQAQELNQPLPVATIIGANPAFYLAATDPSPIDVDEYLLAGGLNGSPLKTVKCKTIDLDVPADAEIIIEGEILPGHVEDEAPFAEWHGGYGMTRICPVMTVKAITMRKNPIYQTLLAAGISPNESNIMHWVFMTEAVWQAANMACPEVKDVYLSSNIAEAVVSIKKRLETEAVNVIYSCLTNVRILKYVTVVDDDIDVHNRNYVDWARLTRVQPNKDVYILPTMVSVPLDPSADLPKQSSTMGIDATKKPMDSPKLRYIEAGVPGTDEVKW